MGMEVQVLATWLQLPRPGLYRPIVGSTFDSGTLQRLCVLRVVHSGGLPCSLTALANTLIACGLLDLWSTPSARLSEPLAC